MRCFADEKVMILSNGNSEKHSEKVTGEKSFSQSYSIILELDKDVARKLRVSERANLEQVLIR
jgi:hypothetical protein